MEKTTNGYIDFGGDSGTYSTPKGKTFIDGKKQRTKYGEKMAEGITQGQASAIGTAAEGAGQLIGGIAGVMNQGQLEEDASTALSTALADLEKVRSEQPSLATPSSYYEGVKDAYDQRLLGMRMDDINRSLATTTQAATQFGARGLGALPGASAQAQRSQREEVLTQQKLQGAALMQLGEAEQRSQQLQESRSQKDLDYAYDAKVLGEARVAQAGQQKIQNFANIAGGIAGVAGGVIGATMNDGGLVGYKVGGRVEEAPFITGGEFDHDTNKKAVVDEESGEKEAELTGGEYVFNPKQSETLFKLAQEGDTQLHKYLLKLLLKFEKDV